MEGVNLTRRDTLRIGLAGAAAALTGAKAAEAEATGYVFVERDGAARRGAAGGAGLQRPRSRRDRQRRPLAPARAADGRVLRHQAGRLHGPGRSRHRLAALLLICTSPEGSPAALDLTFAGIAPTGPLPASIDFTLQPAGRAGTLRGRAVHRSAAGDPRSRSTTSARTSSRRWRERRRSSASPPATSCSTISRCTTATIASSARSACRGGTSAATTTSTTRPRTARCRARRSSACSAPTTMRSSTPGRCS